MRVMGFLLEQQALPLPWGLLPSLSPRFYDPGDTVMQGWSVDQGLGGVHVSATHTGSSCCLRKIYQAPSEEWRASWGTRPFSLPLLALCFSF